MEPDRKQLREVALSSPAGFLAFGFGTGLSRWAPGTLGTLVAVPIAIALQPLPVIAQLAIIIVLFIAGVFLCDLTSRQLGVHDHGGIVWDEIVGYLFCATAAPDSATGYLLAFVLFRVFDIFKPWPIRAIDNKLHGGLGIMADDVAAAAYTAAILYFLRYQGII